MYDKDFQGEFPFPTPISPNMPFDQQLSMSNLNPGMNTRPTPSLDYNFANQYKRGGYVSREGHHSLGDIIESIRSQGHGDDQILAYINPEEARELDRRYGHDINQYTGLPQYGFWDFIKKAIRTVLPIGGAILGNFIAPGIGGVIGGALGGAASGIGHGRRSLSRMGIGALTGGAAGAIQGYGLPLLGKGAAALGMPHAAKALTLAGSSRFMPALGHLGKSVGLGGLGLLPAAAGISSLKKNYLGKGPINLLPPVAQSIAPMIFKGKDPTSALSSVGQSLGSTTQNAPKNDLMSAINYLTGGQQKSSGESGGLGNLLNYLLLD